MKVKKLMLVLVCVTVFMSCTRARINTNSNIIPVAAIAGDAYKQIMDNVFEVVVDKQETEKIKYEKELPFDRLDFKIRNDKYVPVGTAFLLEDGLFYTAEHVVSLELRTQYENYYLRDKNGNIYPFDEIVSFSTHVDYICFSVKGFDTKGKGLKIADSIELNVPVFSVGNALGDGIVIREGVYTSSTPENYEGTWSWLRFSAAANPGNSGGPLVKKDGSVVGIVVMINDTQNLNYAVPIKEAIKGVKNNLGEVNQKFYSYQLPNIENEIFYTEVNDSFNLPKTLNELRNQVASLYDKVANKAVSDIREQFEPSRPKSFDNTRGSAELLYYESHSECPILLYRTKTGFWETSFLDDLSSTKLKNNGSVKNVVGFNTSFCILKKPDDVSLQELIDNPKLCAEYFLEGAPLYRSFAGERIKITSLGDPYRSEEYIDYFGRTWLVNYFDLLFSDQMVVTFSLPIPGGILEMCQISTFGKALNSTYLDLQFLADFTLMSYKAKVKDWKEYLTLSGDMLKTAKCESSIFIKSTDEGIEVNAGDKLSMDLSSDIIEIGEEGYITISFSCEKSEGNKVVLKPSSIRLETFAKARDPRIIYWGIKNKPNEGALDETIDDWYKITHNIFPFDGEPYKKGKDSILDKGYLPKNFSPENANYAYVLSFNAMGVNDIDFHKKEAEKIELCLRIE